MRITKVHTGLTPFTPVTYRERTLTTFFVAQHPISLSKKVYGHLWNLRGHGTYPGKHMYTHIIRSPTRQTQI